MTGDDRPLGRFNTYLNAMRAPLTHQLQSSPEPHFDAADRAGAGVRLAWWAAVLLSAVAIGFHVHEWLSAGGLWRDEVNSVVLCNRPIADLWANLQFDSFPLLWHLILKAWIHVIGSSDRAIRLLGLCVGTGTVAALWCNARALGHRIPLIELLLLQFLPATPMYGDSIRGYGLGACLAILTVATTWSMASTGGYRATVLALCVSLCSVHITFYNSVVVLACCAGGVAVALRSYGVGRAAIVLGVGLLCAASDLVYLPVIRRATSFTAITRVPFSFHNAWSNWLTALGPVDPVSGEPLASSVRAWVWVGLVLLMIIAGTWVALGRDRHAGGRKLARLALCYGCVTSIVGLIGYAAFLRTLQYNMQPWYFVVGLAMVAGCQGAIAIGLFESRYLTTVTAFVGVAAIGLGRNVWTATEFSKTDIPQIARALDAVYRRGDVVLCDPWYYQITLNYYWPHPQAIQAWPPVASTTIHRYDRLPPFMTDINSFGPIKRDLTRTLLEGHCIWLIAAPPFFETADQFEPAPRAESGWSLMYYQTIWSMQLNHFLSTQAASIRPVTLQLNSVTVQPFERPKLLRFAGGRPPGSTTPGP